MIKIGMRVCKKCGNNKPLIMANFQIVGGYFVHTCKLCFNLRAKELYLLDKVHRRKRSRENYAKSRPQRRVNANRNNQECRIEVLSHYSGGKPKCKCCGERTDQFLTLDHINNDGNIQRRELGQRKPMYRRLRRLGFPAGYQVLCWNCNCGRAKNGGICPHKQK